MMSDQPRVSEIEADPHEERTLYGRRKGKKLRVRQSHLVSDLLPSLALDPAAQIADPRDLFPAAVDAVRMEIGFGGAEHLVAEAARQPGIGFIGCEPFVNGVAKLLVQIDERGLQNIRVHHGDARQILQRLPDGRLDRVDVLYPDPWPKWRQRKRRFLSTDNLYEIARVLRPGGVLHVATDIDDYAGWVLARVAHMDELSWSARAAGDWLTPWPHWPGTRYEAKAYREGRAPVYLEFTRSGGAASGSTP
jgi:tRNA (guanine-N7-)-methyltransferase